MIATLVGYGCHPVATGHDLFIYSADFPGAMRDAVRGLTGGECTYFQGAGGNVLPRFSFNVDENEAKRMACVSQWPPSSSVADAYCDSSRDRCPQRQFGQYLLGLSTSGSRRTRASARGSDAVRRRPAHATPRTSRCRGAAEKYESELEELEATGRRRTGQGCVLPRGLGSEDRVPAPQRDGANVGQRTRQRSQNR